jgi:DNA (cytosine-5)-methyltransferase 1
MTVQPDRPKLLDLFCKAGGASMGYSRAGFDVTGVDIEPQRRYPFAFVQADALEYLAAHGHEYDVIHASPPCQAYSEMTPLRFRDRHADLIAPTRQLLIEAGRPYIIENVPNARRHLINPVMLCGSMFGLPIFRHRYFETSWGLMFAPFSCCHDYRPVLITDHGGPNANGPGKPRKRTPVEDKRAAAQLDWMTEAEITDAIPPTYTEWLGHQALGLFAQEGYR